MRIPAIPAHSLVQMEEFWHVSFSDAPDFRPGDAMGSVPGREVPGKVPVEWIADSQEFVHTKLPKLIVIAIIGFIFNHLRHTGIPAPSAEPRRR